MLIGREIKKDQCYFTLDSTVFTVFLPCVGYTVFTTVVPSVCKPAFTLNAHTKENPVDQMELAYLFKVAQRGH